MRWVALKHRGKEAGRSSSPHFGLSTAAPLSLSHDARGRRLSTMNSGGWSSSSPLHSDAVPRDAVRPSPAAHPASLCRCESSIGCVEWAWVGAAVRALQDVEWEVCGEEGVGGVVRWRRRGRVPTGGRESGNESVMMMCSFHSLLRPPPHSVRMDSPRPPSSPLSLPHLV